MRFTFCWLFLIGRISNIFANGFLVIVRLLQNFVAPKAALRNAALELALFVHICRYCISELTLTGGVARCRYLTLLHGVVRESTVCLMGHERRQTLALIEALACRELCARAPLLLAPPYYVCVCAACAACPGCAAASAGACPGCAQCAPPAPYCECCRAASCPA